MQKVVLFFLFLILVSTSAQTLRAGDGMWLPLLLEQLNEAEMRGMGMKMTAEDIYSVNKGSLKDAIVHFGGFCTGEVISDQGLVLTNHHCGYGSIQSHSTLENNYLEDGFWAADREKERPNPGLFVTFIVRMEDVTSGMLRGVEENMGARERQSIVDKNMADVLAAIAHEEHEDVMIKPFFEGNQYFAFVTETYNDVRLVGAPPSSIGKFGADTDNWEWPRHTGDFSLFRIYAGPDGKPAAYSTDNVPLKPRHHLPVSTAGVKEGDFTLVFGFPGRTESYLPAAAVKQRAEVINPVRIGIRDSSLAVIDAAMRRDAQIKIDYASKQSRIANSWKKWKGESLGIAQTGAVAIKRRREVDFQQRLNTEDRKELYGEVLGQMEQAYNLLEPYAVSQAYIYEIGNYNIDLFRLANRLERYVRIQEAQGDSALLARAPGMVDYINDFYAGYHPEVDRAITEKMLPIYFQRVTEKHQSQYARDQREFAGGTRALVDHLYTKSFLVQADQVKKLAAADPVALLNQLKGDPAYQFATDILRTADKEVSKSYNQYQERIDGLQTRYMAGLMEVFDKERFYPDANSTMRVSYGLVEGYTPAPGKTYDYATYLDGVVAKYQPGDYEFDLPKKLLELHAAKDYGPYADAEGRMPVCFLGSNHTTGGNSGSPAIDARGRLVGLNFDRVWEGTMSDIYYDRSICRNIMVDMRYVLFIIDKLGGAKHLVDEMSLVSE